MARRYAAPRPALATLPLVLLLALIVPAPAAAIEPPPELTYVCVDAQDDVHYAATPADCTAKETLRTLPADGPVHWCADQLGRLKEVASASACSSKEQPVTVPDDGPVFVCAGNIRGGRTEPRGTLRVVVDISACDPDETGMVTPAAPEGVDDTYAIDEDTQLVVPDKGVLDNDRDITGAPLTVHLVTGPARGTLALAAGGGFTFDPRGVYDSLDAGESATTTFRYTADDGALVSQPTTVTITVTGRNDRPVAVGDVITTDEDTVLQLTPPGVLGNDTDAEDHQLTGELVEAPEHGEVTLHGDGGLRFDPLADFQHFGAVPGDDGAATFTYLTRDGTSSSDAATVTVEVVGVNDAPVASADSFSTDENTPLDIAAAQLLDDDVDAEGQPLSVTEVDFPASGSGMLITLPDGTLRFDPDADSGDADSDPDFDHLTHGEEATVQLTYRADDGALTSPPATVSITVHGLSAPTANDDVRATDEDQAIAIDLFGNDQVLGGALTLGTGGTGGQVTQEGGGVVRYDPRTAFDHLPAGNTTTDTFDYTLTNGEGSSTGTVIVAVTGVNDAPVATDDAYQVQPGTVLRVPGAATHDPDACATDACDLLANDVDVDTPHRDLVSLLVSPPDRGRLALDPDGGFSYDPAGEFGETGGQTTFSYRADDGSAESATATVTLSVSTNAAPVFAGEPYEFTILATDPAGAFVGAVQATDGDSDPLTFTILSSDTPAFGLDAGTGDLTVGASGAPASGVYELTIGVSDGRGGSDQATVTVRVVPELDAVDDIYTAVGNTELVGGAPAPGSFTDRAAVRVGSLLANDGGCSDCVVPLTDVVTAEGGSVDIAADGSFVYTPPPADPNDDAAWDGQEPLSDTFAYTVERGDFADTGEATITVLDAVWYVDNAVPGTGSGTAQDPFGSLPGVSGDDPAAPDSDLTGQTIFLFGHSDDPGTTADESAYPGGVALEEGQSLVGQASGLTITGAAAGDIPVVATGPAPRITAPAAAAAVVLAADNALRGFTVGGGGDGIVGSAPGALVVALTEVATAGDPLNLTGAGDPVDVGIDNVGGPGTGGALNLDDLGGTVAIGDVDLADGAGITITDGQGSVDIDSADLGDDSLTVTGNTGTLAIDELTGSGAGTGIEISGNDGTIELGTVDLDGVTGTGVAIADDDGTTSIGGGAISGDARTLSGALLAVSGGGEVTTGTVTVGADLLLEPAETGPATRSGRSVDVTGVGPAGTVEVSGQIVDHGLGIQVIDVPGTVRLSGGVDVSTSNTPAMYGARIGTLEIPGSPADVRLAGGPAATLHLDDVGIGAAGARFDHVDSAGALLDPTADPATTGTAIVLQDVTGGTGPGLEVIAGTITAPEVAGAAVSDSSGITLGGLLVDESADDGVVVTDSTGIAVDGVTVQQPDGIGIDASGSGDLLVERSTVSSAGSYGVRLSDLAGGTTLRGSTIENSRNTQLLVIDDTASSAAQDAVVLESTVVSGGEEEDDSIAVTVSDAADLEFRVTGTTPSGSLGGNVGLNAHAGAGAKLEVDLQRFAVADTADDGIRFTALGNGTELTFDLATMDNSGGGGVQLAGGAGIRAVGDGDATISGTLNEVNVGATTDSGVVLHQVDGVVLTVVGIQGTGRHGIEVTESADVRLDQVEVTRPAQHGMYVFDGTDIRVDDSRFDLRPPPPAEPGEPETYDDFSAIRMRHLGGVDNAVTDTTLRGSTGDQLMVLEGTSVSGLSTQATIAISGLTAVETALDPHPDDDVVPDGDAVTVVAGTDADLTVDLDGNASSTDERFAMTAEDGGSLTVTGGHPIEHDGKDDTLVLEATGAGTSGMPSTVRLAIDGLGVTQVAPDDPATPAPGHALLVEADFGGTVVPAIAGTPSITDSTVRSVGQSDAVELLADEPGSVLDVRTQALDVAFTVPSGVTSSADAVSVTGQDEGVVSMVEIAGGTIAAHGGEGIDVQTAGSPVPQPPPLPPIEGPHGTISSVAIDGVTVSGGDGDGIEATGQVDDLTVSGTTVDGGSGNGIRVLGTGCVALDGNDTTAVGDTGYVLNDVGLLDFRPVDHPTETVGQWLARHANTGPPDSRLESHSDVSGCAR